jgi:hypothetical protein
MRRHWMKFFIKTDWIACDAEINSVLIRLCIGNESVLTLCAQQMNALHRKVQPQSC